MLAGSPSGTRHHVPIRDVTIDVDVVGSGPPLLLLHPGFPSGPISPRSEIVEHLARHHTVMLPTHPAFGDELPPSWVTSIDDLAYLYLDLLAVVAEQTMTVVGASLGGWIASAMAVMSTERIERLVLVNPVGIKVGGREERDIVDVFSCTDQELAARAFAEPAEGTPNHAAMTDEELTIIATSRTATARYGWSPYLHDPKLKRRLARVRVPTMVVSGSEDRLTAPGYAAAFAGSIDGAALETIEGAGHFPHLERPAELAALIAAHVDTSGSGGAP